MPSTRARHALSALAAALVLGGLVGCGSAPEEIDTSGVDELEIPTPSPRPADFVTRIDNPLLPLAPGSVWTYAVTGEDGPRTVTVTVTNRTKVIQGVRTTVVHDVVTDGAGTVVQDTWDWFAQDRAGNVWYFGEDTTAYDGTKESTEGSWQAGTNGAMAGVVMLAEPRVGDGYEQESAPGEAEDRAVVRALDESTEVPFGSFDGLLETEDTTPLVPGLLRRTLYARGVGLVREETVSGGEETVALVRFTKP